MAQTSIVVAESNPELAAQLQDILGKLGYTDCRVATTLANAIDQVKTAKPDLAIINIRMEDQWKSIQTAEATQQKWNVPVILLTDPNDTEALQRGKAIGAAGFIRNPPDSNEILATIQTTLDKQWIERRLQESEQKYRSMMEAIGDLVYICSPDRRVEYINPAMKRMLGRDATNETCYRIFFEGAQPCAWCVMQQVQKGQIVHHELTNPRDGRVYHVTSTPIVHADGTISKMSIMTDITEQRRAELALKASELRNRRLVESVTDYIYTVKVQNGRAISTAHGQACITITGWTSEEYAADPDLWFKMVYEEDRLRVLEQAAKLLAGQSSQTLEHRIIHKNGQIRWIRNTPVPHHDSQGELIAYDGLVSDITERKQAEEQLKEHARKLEILNRIISAVNRATDLTAMLDEVLRASLDLLRFSGGGIYMVDAKSATAELSSAYNLPHEYVRARRRVNILEHQYKEFFFDGKPLFADNYALIAPDKARAWQIASATRVPLTAKDKIIGGLLLVNQKLHHFDEAEREILMAIGRQIGTAIEKIRAERALRESEDKYRTISEQSLVGIQMIKDGKMIFVNDGWSKITGYKREEALNWEFEEFQQIIMPEDRKMFLDQVRKKQLGVTEGVMPVYDFRFISKNGQARWVLLHSKSVQFADGHAVIGVVIDITERKQAEQDLANANRKLMAREQELLGANRDKEVLLKEIHHRVKNNLQIVSSLLKLQLGHLRDQQAAAIIRDCQNRIRSIAIVHEQLYQSRNLAEIDVGHYIHNLANHLFRTFLIDPGMVKMQIAVDDLALHIDQAIPCSLIINELVSNSLKYAFPENRRGTINVTIQPSEAGQIKLLVSDDGVGLPANIDFKNTASLGLQLVMTFVEQLNGKISLASGKGTTFSITFPAIRKKETGQNNCTRAQGESNSSSQDENLVS